ncbi:SIMPL domain-containing protein [Novosphingobium sp. B 225]|uniref:SIMPL domain-containing protein n=1 Tax=Novosphingobium sp. B 225 TaxID=1961849 RepID=UPI000B4B89FD|nr:SIMPL domain-containing protein [Novosphingobium sp. B 225]
MKSLKFALAPLALALALPGVAMAQNVQSGPVVAAGNTLLSVNGEGRATRVPDLAVFSAGVTSQAATAGAAMSANAAQMNKVIAALKTAGIADKDVQTSQISLNPVYGDQQVSPNGTMRAPRIVGYQAGNTVSVKQRDLKQFGKVLDTLVASGANEVNGPNFQLDNPDAAMDEARVAAIKSARARADLYAKAAGLRVVRILTISEGGGYSPPQPVMFTKAAMMADAAPTPVAAGQLDLTVSVNVQFELAP